MGTYSDFTAVKQAVVQNDGILSIEMRELRDAYGADRLGIYVRQGIQDSLQGQGLGHTPEELPQYQEEMVRLYKKWLRKSEQGDKWNRCLNEGMIVLSETGARDEQTTPP